MAGLISPDGVPDAGAFLARVTRLDPGAVVRLRPSGTDRVALWARLPFGVLATRLVRGRVSGDQTVAAGALLATLGTDAWPARDDAAWRWPLPPADGWRVVETVPAAALHRLGAAAEATLRSAISGRTVGTRILRDALLDHVPLVVVTDDGERIEVGQRLVQGLARMSFVGELPVEVIVAGPLTRPWVCLAAEYGSAWHRGEDLLRLRPNG